MSNNPVNISTKKKKNFLHDCHVAYFARREWVLVSLCRITIIFEMVVVSDFRKAT